METTCRFRHRAEDDITRSISEMRWVGVAAGRGK